MIEHSGGQDARVVADVPPGMETPLAFALEERNRETLNMVSDALHHRNMFLAFQPVMQARQFNHPAFHEGLIRIVDSVGRVIPAREFISVAETSELGRRIDCAALELGLQALAAEPSLRLSVNMSARSIGYPAWMRTLKHGLSRERTIGERLILEITESSAMLMPEIVSVFMEDLQRRGISFALDDFGAGYTAFRYFREFYFDIVKIDGQFIRDIHSNRDNQVLTKALIAIAQHFEMFTVAEQVETAEDAAFLATLGIDCMQGYYFGVPTTLPSWSVPMASKRA